jgi:hypothetical protein
MRRVLDYDQPKAGRKVWPTWIIFGLIPVTLAIAGAVAIRVLHDWYYSP